MIQILSIIYVTTASLHYKHDREMTLCLWISSHHISTPKGIWWYYRSTLKALCRISLHNTQYYLHFVYNSIWKPSMNEEVSMFKHFTGYKIMMSLNCMTFKVSCTLYDTVYTGKQVPTFHSYLLPPSSRCSFKAALYICLPLYTSLPLKITQLT